MEQESSQRIDFKHKPDGAPSSGPVGTGSSKSQITNQMQMSLDEAHLILNAKKEDPMEIIERVRPSRPHANFEIREGN